MLFIAHATMVLMGLITINPLHTGMFLKNHAMFWGTFYIIAEKCIKMSFRYICLHERQKYVSLTG